MRSFIHFILAICCMGLMAVSCRTTEMICLQPEMERQWIGRSYADIIDSMGAPDREVADLQDGKILVYDAGSTRLYINSDSYCYAVRTNKQREETKLDMSRSWALGGAIAGGIIATSSIIQTIFGLLELGVRK